jgi:hypothetical protein
MERNVTFDQFRRHNHDGIETDKIDFDFSSIVVSFYSPFRDSDTNTAVVTDDDDYLPSFSNGSTTIELLGGPSRYQRRNTTSDWAAADQPWSTVKVGPYLYVLLQDTGATPDEWRIYRYDKDNLAGGGTLMTFSGTSPDLTTDRTLRLTSDGTFFYLNYDGGNSANAYVIAKYSLSGTSFVYDSSITCGSATLGFNTTFQVLSDRSIYTLDQTNDNISKFDRTGTLVYTDTAGTLITALETLSNIEDTLFAYHGTQRVFIKIYYS